jgi:hypothetical protein
MSSEIQQRMSAIADAEGEAERIRETADLPGELDRGPFPEKIRCDDCSWEAQVTSHNAGRRWREHKQMFGCRRYTLTWRTNYREPQEDEEP